MAIIGEMCGAPLDDCVYRKMNESSGSRLRVETISNNYEGLFDDSLKHFVDTHDCVDIKILRYDPSKVYKAIVVYRERIDRR